MVSALISRLIILVFGNLYPAYASYKAIRNQNVKEYVKWMVYWIVFALFCCVETFSDIFLSWFPFYYEIKIVFLLWLLSPLTKGSRFLFRKFVHPQLTKHGDSIDEYISQLRTKGYTAVLKIGTTVISNATNLLINTAMKGKYKLADHVRRSYSMNDLNGERRAILQEEIDNDAIQGLSDEEQEDEDQLDNRLREDNRELERKKLIRKKSLEKKDKREIKEKKRPLQRSSSLERVAEDEEEEVITTEEIVYIPIKQGSRAYKETQKSSRATSKLIESENFPFIDSEDEIDSSNKRSISSGRLNDSSSPSTKFTPSSTRYSQRTLTAPSSPKLCTSPPITSRVVANSPTIVNMNISALQKKIEASGGSPPSPSRSRQLRSGIAYPKTNPS